MAIQRIKPIDALYAEVAEHDLVVVPDVALASALNRRLDTPHFGPFAVTPRRLAAPRREGSEARAAFLEVVQHTDLGWKEAAVAIEEVLQCWEHEGRPEAILSYDGFDTPAIREVVRRHDEFSITSARLARYTIDPTRYPSVAVIEPSQLTTLEQSILPADFTRVELFTDEPFDHPTFRLFDSPGQIVDTLTDHITPETASDIGIVLEAGSEYGTLLESALEEQEIPYHGGPGFTDDPDLRAFVACLESVFAGADTRVGAIRPALSHLGIPIEITHDEKRLSTVDDPRFDWLAAYIDACRDGMLAGALARFEDQLGHSLPTLEEELQELGVLDVPLTEAVLDRVLFYLTSYDVPIDRDHAGVLLANPTTAAYVDRPLVFCLGLDEGWTHETPRRPWVDRDDAFTRKLRNFELILQSGTEREYLVVDAAGGRPVSPSLYLAELFDDTVERFRDLPADEYGRASHTAGHGFERQTGVVTSSPTAVDTISQSRLNSLVACPRDYLFAALVDAPERVPLVEGSLFHDFAEFYLAHPEHIEGEAGKPDPAKLRECADVMSSRVRPFYDPATHDAHHTRVLAGLETIVCYVRTSVPDTGTVETDLERPEWAGNVFADHFDVALRATRTELWFEDDTLGIRGLIDLLAAEDHLVDFKSGTKHTARRVTTASAMNPPTEAPNYQALLYLTYLRSIRPDRPLRFDFVHLLETADEAVTGTPNPEECIVEIRYLPETYDAFLRSEAAFEGLCVDAANDCTKTFSRIEIETWRAILDEVDVPHTRDADELIASSFHPVLTAKLREEVGAYQFVTNGCKQACRHLASLRQRHYFRDDLDAFEEFVADRLDDVNAYRRGEDRFPVAGLGGEPDWRRVDHRDMLLEDEIAAVPRGN